MGGQINEAVAGHSGDGGAEMRESSLVPTNLLSWPRVENRLTEEKFILQSLWSAGWIKSIGVGEVPLASFCAALGLPRDSTERGLLNLEDGGLIKWDRETNEICILDWFRFHKFKHRGVDIARGEIKKIQSEVIKSLVTEKSMTCLPTATATATATATETTTPPSGGGGGEFTKKSETQTNPNQVWQNGDETGSMQDFVDAAIHNHTKTVVINNLLNFSSGVRRRLRKSGPDPEDWLALSNLRSFQSKSALPAQTDEDVRMAEEKNKRRENAQKRFEEMDESTKDEMLSKFSDHIKSTDKFAHSIFFKNGLDSPLVRSQFFGWLEQYLM